MSRLLFDFVIIFMLEQIILEREARVAITSNVLKTLTGICFRLLRQMLKIFF